MIIVFKNMHAYLIMMQLHMYWEIFKHANIQIYVNSDICQGKRNHSRYFNIKVSNIGNCLLAKALTTQEV